MVQMTSSCWWLQAGILEKSPNRMETKVDWAFFRAWICFCFQLLWDLENPLPLQFWWVAHCHSAEVRYFISCADVKTLQDSPKDLPTGQGRSALAVWSWHHPEVTGDIRWLLVKAWKNTNTESSATTNPAGDSQFALRFEGKSLAKVCWNLEEPSGWVIAKYLKVLVDSARGIWNTAAISATGQPKHALQQLRHAIHPKDRPWTTLCRRKNLLGFGRNAVNAQTWRTTRNQRGILSRETGLTTNKNGSRFQPRKWSLFFGAKTAQKFRGVHWIQLAARMASSQAPNGASSWCD